MNRNRSTKFLLGAFTLSILVVILSFLLISCDPQTVSTPVVDSAAPAAPITSEIIPTEQTAPIPAPETVPQ
jgi:hypothetical protein